jgi:transketolase
MAFSLGARRGTYCDVTEELGRGKPPVSANRIELLNGFDLIYRSLCALLFNYVPASGHPGGSISAGRFMAGLLLGSMDYDISRPKREDADVISLGAGHKTMGLYSLLAMRSEALRIAAPRLLPKDERFQIRLEDLLGFRRNPIAGTPLLKKFRAKVLDGHPTPATPFVRLSTGASGVGIGSSIGLALGALDYYGANAPRVHIVEGEGGLTPGRVSEALAAAGTACLNNVILHIDWNQASIDSNHVCRNDGVPGVCPVDAGGTGLLSRLERGLCSRRDGLAADLCRPEKSPGDEQQPAHGRRLPDGQGVEVRDRGEGIPRGRAQTLRRKFLRSPEALHRLREGFPPQV